MGAPLPCPRGICCEATEGACGSGEAVNYRAVSDSMPGVTDHGI